MTLTRIIPALLLIPTLLTHPHTHAQATENKYQIAIHPTYAAITAIRIDIERKMSLPNNWLTLGIAGYAGSQQTDETLGLPIDYLDPDANRWQPILGGSAELSLKQFIDYPRQKWLFMSVGISTAYYTYRHAASNYIPFMEDGLQYYESGRTWHRHHVPKMGGHISIGVQFPSRSRVFVDGSLGLGYNYSFYDKDDYTPTGYYDYVYGLSRRGLYPTGTFRIGVRLGKL
jgi:hypothetical protein